MVEYDYICDIGNMKTLYKKRKAQKLKFLEAFESS